jgi:transposase
LTAGATWAPDSAWCLATLDPRPHLQRGSRYLRMLLVQAARVLLIRPHTWSRSSFGAWLRTASQRLHRHKLAVAPANKLARIAWSVLYHDKAFDTHLEIAAI